MVTYEELIMTDSLPESIIIAGAGAIGVEFAYVMANYGVEVTLVEFLDRVVPLEEPEVSKELAKAYKKLGVTVLTGTKVEAIDDSGDKVKVTVSPAAGGDSKVLEADKVLQAIGFAPRTEGYGLDKHRRRSSPIAARSRSTTTCAPTCRTSTRSATARRSCCWPTPPRRREWSLRRPSPARRPCRSTTT